MSFTMYCVTDALTAVVQSNSINPVGFYGTPGQSITVQVSGSAAINGMNPVILDETGYGRVDITDVVAESVTVTAMQGSYQQSGQMSFVADYTITADGSGNRYQLTKNAPADGKTPNVIYSADLHGVMLSLTGSALFANGTNHYDSQGEINVAVEVYDQYPETAFLFESTGIEVGDIIFIPVV